MNNIEIKQESRDVAYLIIDGVKLDGVKSIKYTNSVGEIPTMELELTPLGEVRIGINQNRGDE